MNARQDLDAVNELALERAAVTPRARVLLVDAAIAPEGFVDVDQGDELEQIDDARWAREVLRAHPVHEER